MLRLIYNPSYDQPVYSGDESVTTAFLGKKYLGKNGLLDELELRLGLSHPEIPDAERLVSYYKSVKGADKIFQNLFFHSSFQNDPLGVSATLLKWRDALVYAGWKKSDYFPVSPEKLFHLMPSTQEKLIGLASVEEVWDQQEDGLSNSGVSDHWMDVLEAVSQEGENNLSYLSIKIAMSEDLFTKSDPILHKIILLLRDHCQVKVEFEENTAAIKDQKIHLFKFPEQRDAFQWLFVGKHDDELRQLDNALKENRALLVNQDNVSFNGFLDCLGKARVSSQFEGVGTSILQIFRNGLTQFRKPVDINGLQNYLSSPYHPLNKIYISYEQEENAERVQKRFSLKDVLRKHLERMSGFGKNDHAVEIKDKNTGEPLLSFKGLDWHEIIEKFEKEGHGNEDYKVGNILGFWETNASYYKGNECFVKIEALHSYCSAMMKWCRAEKSENSLVREQIRLVRTYFQSLESILAIVGHQDISYSDLMKYADAIASPESLNGNQEETGAVHLIREASAIAENVSVPVIWMDCYDKGDVNYDYDFIILEDIGKMQETISIPTKTSVCREKYETLKNALGKVADLYLLFPSKVSGKRAQEHTLFNWYKSEYGIHVNNCEEWKLEYDAISENDIVEAKTQVAEYHIKPGIITPDMFPKYESPSSLEKLFNYPFDYVMKYIFHLDEKDNSGLSTLKGSVAHLFIHNMFDKINTDGEMTPEEFEEYCNSDFDSKLRSAAEQEGVLLLSPENQSEYKRFKSIFKEISLPNLIKIMKQYDLKMVGSEYSFKNKALLKIHANDYCHLSGFIDCIMIDKASNPIIFDFKWTESKSGFKEREKEIKENKALQLYIYRMAVEQILRSPAAAEICKGTEVKGCAYYMLRQGELLTDCPVFAAPQLSIIKYYSQNLNSFEDLVEKICNLYEFRKAQILHGKIEEGEGLSLTGSDISYMEKINQDAKFFPIKGLKKDKLIKESTFNSYYVLKGLLK